MKKQTMWMVLLILLISILPTVHSISADERQKLAGNLLLEIRDAQNEIDVIQNVYYAGEHKNAAKSIFTLEGNIKSVDDEIRASLESQIIKYKLKELPKDQYEKFIESANQALYDTDIGWRLQVLNEQFQKLQELKISLFSGELNVDSPSVQSTISDIENKVKSTDSTVKKTGVEIVDATSKAIQDKDKAKVISEIDNARNKISDRMNGLEKTKITSKNVDLNIYEEPIYYGGSALKLGSTLGWSFAALVIAAIAAVYIRKKLVLQEKTGIFKKLFELTSKIKHLESEETILLKEKLKQSDKDIEKLFELLNALGINADILRLPEHGVGNAMKQPDNAGKLAMVWEENSQKIIREWYTDVLRTKELKLKTYNERLKNDLKKIMKYLEPGEIKEYRISLEKNIKQINEIEKNLFKKHGTSEINVTDVQGNVIVENAIPVQSMLDSLNEIKKLRAAEEQIIYSETDAELNEFAVLVKEIEKGILLENAFIKKEKEVLGAFLSKTKIEGSNLPEIMAVLIISVLRLKRTIAAEIESNKKAEELERKLEKSTEKISDKEKEIEKEEEKIRRARKEYAEFPLKLKGSAKTKEIDDIFTFIEALKHEQDIPEDTLLFLIRNKNGTSDLTEWLAKSLKREKIAELIKRKIEQRDPENLLKIPGTDKQFIDTVKKSSGYPIFERALKEIRYEIRAILEKNINL